MASHRPGERPARASAVCVSIARSQPIGRALRACFCLSSRGEMEGHAPGPELEGRVASRLVSCIEASLDTACRVGVELLACCMSHMYHLVKRSLVFAKVLCTCTLLFAGLHFGEFGRRRPALDATLPECGTPAANAAVPPPRPERGLLWPCGRCLCTPLASSVRAGQ